MGWMLFLDSLFFWGWLVEVPHAITSRNTKEDDAAAGDDPCDDAKPRKKTHSSALPPYLGE